MGFQRPHRLDDTAYKLISVDAVRSGKFRVPNKKPLPENKRPVSLDIVPDSQDFTQVSDDEDLPF